MNPEQFAISVTERLQAAGYTALFAGGCVRDALLGRAPKDYDVATSATPDQVQELFGHKRTLAIGKSFGVITVLGPKSADPIEVATFRRDGGYSDGRRPDSVEFTNAKEDALRRDFTINGMFFDPVTNEVIDYVGGEEDIKLKRVRAIGNPDERIEEDKLRMLRGVRFAATYGFELEQTTLAAIQSRAHEIDAVSAERIGNELRRMLTHKNKSQAFELLVKSKLWDAILPELDESWDGFTDVPRKQELLDQYRCNDFSVVIVLLFARLLRQSSPSSLPSRLQSAWRLTNAEVDRVVWIIKHGEQLAKANEEPWSVIQPLLISPHASFAIDALEVQGEEHESAVSFCRERLSWDRKKLDPPPLIDGAALKSIGIEPGPEYKEILGKVRRMQLDGEIETPEEARELVRGRKSEFGSEG